MPTPLWILLTHDPTCRKLVQGSLTKSTVFTSHSMPGRLVHSWAYPRGRSGSCRHRCIGPQESGGRLAWQGRFLKCSWACSNLPACQRSLWPYPLQGLPHKPRIHAVHRFRSVKIVEDARNETQRRVPKEEVER